ncbi:helix-turn-helix domain-containing protein [Paraburkholderia antibiotica]|uniref:Winged helix-turn-helix domain-containing protein n=1 Tax=Paraburkholderia antibiotica TaxID=2728839 RepID=A0A7Y0A2V1_9BURK|nr:winged helix-turn-helix domain-containing protein [Paraburkholderia antibiotica]
MAWLHVANPIHARLTCGSANKGRGGITPGLWKAKNRGNLIARLARFLLRRDGAIVRTHYAIAIEQGTAREVVSRQLRGFEQRGWLTLRRGRIELLHRAVLQALHDESVTKSLIRETG